MSSSLALPESFRVEAAQGWLGLGLPDEAEAELATFPPHLVQHREVLNIRFEICAARADWRQALDFAARMIQAAPGHGLGWVNQSFALHELKRTAEARDHLLSVVDKPAPAKTVLVIDDDAAVLDLLAVTLQQEGLVAVTATNGKEGLEKARSLAPDLILLDVVLPEMDGLTVCSHLRRSRATAGIPIIMLTGLTSTANRAASLDCGADEYITKPFDPARLLSRIQDLLGQAQGTVVGATH